ncbi:hypothetical protein ACQJ6U_04590 [Helicobacter pylori]
MKSTQMKPFDVTLSEDQKTKEQIFKKLKEATLKTKKQELEKKINAICKEKILNGFKSNYKTL